MGKYLMEALPGQLHGTVRTTVVTVSGGPTLLPASALQGRKDFMVYNPTVNAQPVYVGGNDVSWENGVPVEAGGFFGFQAGRAQMYGTISGTGTITVRVMEIS